MNPEGNMDQLIESDEAGNEAQTAIDAQATTWDLTRKAYMDRGVGIDYWVPDRRIVRRTKEEHFLAEEIPWMTPETD
jgi:hypothetical protein